MSLCEADDETPQALYARGLANGVPGLQLLTGLETRKLEPNLFPAVRGALLAPSAGIVNPRELCYAMAETAVRNGADLRLSARVTAIARQAGGFCGPRVQEIIARELGVDPTEVLMDWEGTWVLCGETKGGPAK